MSLTAIPCLVLRGGTSKGAYFLDSDLPADPALRDQVLLAAMGSPDPRQIDGIGGAQPLTSKVAVVRRSQRPDADVDYHFAQVVVDAPRVDWGQNCGNLLAGVGPFALERGLVQAQGELTPVRIFMVNTGQLALAHVPTANGRVNYAGSARIDGVPGTAAPLVVEFADVAGSSCGALLPTGNACDTFDGVASTCIDNGMPVVVLRAEALGLSGDETPAALNADQALRERLESIRLQAGHAMGLGDVRQRSVPKMTLVSAPREGGAIATRTFIPHRCHDAIGVFGAVSVAAACLLPGGVCAGLAKVPAGNDVQVQVEHPSGEFTVQLRLDNGQLIGCGLLRTARLLFDGKVMIPATVWSGVASPGD